ncbi:hypothetical protein V7S43_016904 [Phytophthora oleae]|uniref:HNH nuclease domain-containing protein n=1 Tax=Phytophthora oleae TaxID=2107226 RepID=A0ABD3EYB6_9STRA
MASLYCGVVGEAGSAFLIDIEEGKSVDQLKDAIKRKKSATINCDANMLQLFLAKKNGVWLTEADVKEGVSDTTGLEPLKAARASLRSVGLSDEDVGGVDEAEAAEGRGPVNVLVVVPEQDDDRFPAMDVLEVMLPHVLTHAPTTLIKQSVNFKDDLCEFYGCYRRKKRWVRCMLLDVAFPQSLVIALHLFRHSNEYLAPVLMKISDIDDMKNGLLLFKPLKHAFDHFQISFILDDTNVFRLKLFDSNIRDLRLVDLKDRDGNKVLSAEQMRVLKNSVSLTRNGCLFDMQTTFGDVDGVHWFRATIRSLFKPAGKNGSRDCLGEALDR